MPFFEIKARTGQPMQFDQVTITPISRAVEIRFPRQSGGIVWNRPVAVVVQPPEGPEKRLAIQDETRFQQFLLFAILFGMVALARVLLRR
jgi:hypothetical protein